METTFITINDLSPEARILFTSDSIVDVLGYAPRDVVNRPCWDFFHPDEIAIAKKRHDHSIRRDKAAVISYAQIKDREGFYVGCEIVFTVVHDVMVGCISIYRRGLKSQSRATEAPVVRRLFSTSPRDPRYHMLSHLSSKFESRAKPTNLEPRAAFFVNRYTRTLTIMHATNGLHEVLGVSDEDLKGRSFYYCIQENCLQDAVRCLENAKANDSIAYLRFWFRDPTQDDDNEQDHWRNPQDGRMDVDSSEDSGVGQSESEDVDMDGVDLNGCGAAHSSQHQPALDIRGSSSATSQAVSSASSVEPVDSAGNYLPTPNGPDSRTSSGDSHPYTHEAIFGEPPERESSASSMSNSPSEQGQGMGRRRRRGNVQPVELEAVVSCTSDGLVVCLRQARAPMTSNELQEPSKSMYANGLFAVPWATNPILPPISKRPQFIHSNGSPKLNGHEASTPASPASAGPDFMNSIREIAVFAWALTGINGSMADYSKGAPRGEAQPAAGLPIWRPEAVHHRANGVDRPSQDSGSQAFGGSDQALMCNGTGLASLQVDEAMGGSINAKLPKPNFSKPLKNAHVQPANHPTNGV